MSRLFARKNRRPHVGGFESDVSEAVRRVLGRRGLEQSAPLPSTIAIVGPTGGEGVSTVARGLARVLASDLDVTTCIIDLSRLAEPDAAPTLLDEVLDGKASFADVESELGDGLVVELPLGASTDTQWHSRISSLEFEGTVKELASRFHFVIFDMPPVLADSRGAPALAHAHSYILVARYGHTAVSDVEETTRSLASLTPLGAILNEDFSRVPKRFRRVLDAA